MKKKIDYDIFERMDAASTDWVNINQEIITTAVKTGNELVKEHKELIERRRSSIISRIKTLFINLIKSWAILASILFVFYWLIVGLSCLIYNSDKKKIDLDFSSGVGYQTNQAFLKGYNNPLTKEDIQNCIIRWRIKQSTGGVSNEENLRSD